MKQSRAVSLAIILCVTLSTSLCRADESSTGPAGIPGTTAGSGNKPLTLYGRIEQLVSQKGAVLPGRLQKMTPILDTSKSSGSDNLDKPFTGQLVQSFPLEWEGTWKGSVRVIKRECVEIGWLSQPAASYRASQFFKPGSSLQLLCRFNKEGSNLSLSAPVVTGNFRHAEDLVKAVLSSSGALSAANASRISLAGVEELTAQTTPMVRVESFSFGKRYGPSLGGNFIDSDLVSNQLRELAAGIIEQDLVTSGKSRSLYGQSDSVSSYGETVVRLTRKEGKLLVDLAYVNYQGDGFCVGKCVLAGTLSRTGD